MAPTDLRLESAGTGGAASALRVIVGAAEIRAGLAEVGQVEAITAACAAGVARGADAAAAAIQGAVDAGTGPRGADGPSDGQDSNAIADDDLRTGPFVCVFTRPRSRQPVPALPFHVQVCPRRGVWGGGEEASGPGKRVLRWSARDGVLAMGCSAAWARWPSGDQRGWGGCRGGAATHASGAWTPGGPPSGRLQRARRMAQARGSPGSKPPRPASQAWTEPAGAIDPEPLHCIAWRYAAPRPVQSLEFWCKASAAGAPFCCGRRRLGLV